MGSTFNLQVFDNARQFLDSQPASMDTAEMNIIIGAARDSLSRPQAPTIWIIVTGVDVNAGNAASKPIDTRSNTLLICGSATMETYCFSKPAEADIPKELLDQIIDSIVTTLVEKSIQKVQSAWGLKTLTDPFLSKWAMRQQPQLQVRAEAVIKSTLAVAGSVPNILQQDKTNETRSRPPVSYSAIDLVTLVAESANDTDKQEVEHIKTELKDCFGDFLGNVNEETIKTIQGWVEGILASKETGRLWIAKADKPNEDKVEEANNPIPTDPTTGSSNKVLGFLLVGRETDRTISIRMVYSRPSFRGYGVATELVTASTKWWLEQAEDHKRKKEVTLFVNPDNTPAVKVYTKCGYTLGGDIWEWRGFEGMSLGTF